MNPTLLKRYAAFLLATLLLAGCATPERQAADKPALIVFFAVDGLPQSQVVNLSAMLR